ncbi:hypothetical protein E3N88_07840 [Mikania micrantha]|uniref:Uncharacterized protein n=1 Tax=Mikania micrantha TaxID=192012 RepID=A0A5N6PHM7_9ASTR|nr:hypothetical protein E3N88_07840 [Mikania micrantha]
MIVVGDCDIGGEDGIVVVGGVGIGGARMDGGHQCGQTDLVEGLRRVEAVLIGLWCSGGGAEEADVWADLQKLRDCCDGLLRPVMLVTAVGFAVTGEGCGRRSLPFGLHFNHYNADTRKKKRVIRSKLNLSPDASANIENKEYNKGSLLLLILLFQLSPDASANIENKEYNKGSSLLLILLLQVMLAPSLSKLEVKIGQPLRDKKSEPVH